MRSTRIPVTAATALALILVAGCGSSGSAASTGSGSSTSAGQSVATSASTSTSASPPQELRDVRYCEVIPAITDGDTIHSTVYNTLGYNNCPERQ